MDNIDDLKGMDGAVRLNLFSPDLFSPDSNRGVWLYIGGKADTSITDILDIVIQWTKQKDPGIRFGLPVPVIPGADTGPLTSCLSGLVEQGLAMIHWQIIKSGVGMHRNLLWTSSKLGIWNHVSGPSLFERNMTDRSWIVNNPDIVHSFENTDALDPGASVTPPRGLFTFSALAPVPGDALWKVIRTPGKLLELLTRYTKKDLLRMRVDTHTGNIFKTGAQIKFFFKRPETVSSADMDQIVAMVDAAGAVDITHVRDNLQKAYLIGYAVENGVIVGNSSLKHPRKIFIQRLKTMTGLDFSGCVERGYTSVRPEYRAMGVGARLLEGLTARATDVKIFSIISEDNPATQKIAIRNNTRKITTYFSDKLKKQMGVWMPEHMIDDDGGPGK